MLDADVIERTLQRIHEGRLVEIRALGVLGRGGRRATCSGYYDDYRAAAEHVTKLDDLNPEGIYMTLQRIHPGLLARSPNRLTVNPKHTTSDRDVIGIDWVLVDCDPIRPSGISSTDEELAAAIEVRDRVHEWSRPSGLRAMSGNGAHLLVPSNGKTPSDVRQLLGLTQAMFATPEVDIDVSVSKPSQLTKLYGTVARKGYQVPGRPHRRSFLE